MSDWKHYVLQFIFIIFSFKELNWKFKFMFCSLFFFLSNRNHNSYSRMYLDIITQRINVIAWYFVRLVAKWLVVCTWCQEIPCFPPAPRWPSCSLSENTPKELIHLVNNNSLEIRKHLTLPIKATWLYVVVGYLVSS